MNRTLLVPITEAARQLGLATKTVRNWISADKFPIKTFLIGSKRMVRTMDLELFVADLGAGNLLRNQESQYSEDIKRKKRGRPRKVATVVIDKEAGK